MQAIILAAGLGERLRDLTRDRPKALVSVGGRELILRVMDFLDHPGISERVVVTGYKSDIMENFLKEHCPDVRTVHNSNFNAGNILTIEAAIPLINSDFILMNADHIYPRRMLGHILKNHNGITAICDFDRTLGSDDMKIKLDENGRLRRISKTLDDFDGGYIGMTLCSSDSIRTYRSTAAYVIEDKGNSACAENILGRMAEDSTGVNICDTSGMPWLEIDTPEDLAHAENVLRNNGDFLS